MMALIEQFTQMISDQVRSYFLNYLIALFLCVHSGNSISCKAYKAFIYWVITVTSCSVLLPSHLPTSGTTIDALLIPLVVHQCCLILFNVSCYLYRYNRHYCIIALYMSSNMMWQTVEIKLGVPL